MRTLTITVAEWASVHDGTLWLVREANAVDVALAQPPIEFVLACAPCYGDENTAHSAGLRCHLCRIGLVGPCQRTDHDFRSHRCHNGTVTLGHAHAIGQPLPIVDADPCPLSEDDPHVCVPDVVMAWDCGDAVDITDRLAHYGPPETLVGKWALQVQVVA